MIRIDWVFLSHLSGDEARVSDGGSFIIFLSHLSGDEGT